MSIYGLFGYFVFMQFIKNIFFEEVKCENLVIMLENGLDNILIIYFVIVFFENVFCWFIMV